MAVSTNQITCPSNTATVILAAANTNSVYVGRGTPRYVTITNPSAQGIYLGGDTSLTTANGYLLPAGATVNLTISAGDALYGRGAQFSPVLHYITSG